LEEENMKRKTIILMISDVMYFIALLLFWVLFWNLVGFEKANVLTLKFWGIISAIIIIVNIRDFKKEFDAKWINPH
jgi:uncharacterized membrane protein (GlpM family)